MRIEKIVTLANMSTSVQFQAMVRSLRAVGSELPVWVIPFDDTRFDLPAGCHWWIEPDVLDWLDSVIAYPVMRKYQCLTTGAYQYVDTDVVFLRDPAAVLRPLDGLVTACTEWNKPQWTVTASSRAMMARRYSTWQRRVFNTGQFASQDPVCTLSDLRRLNDDPEVAETIFGRAWHEQPGLNLVAFLAGVKITNLTLPPHCMESTWAGDYPDAFTPLWGDSERMPYLIHWAGNILTTDAPINALFFRHLSDAERTEWAREMAERVSRRHPGAQWPLWVRLASRAVSRIDSRFQIAWRGPAAL